MGRKEAAAEAKTRAAGNQSRDARLSNNSILALLQIKTIVVQNEMKRRQSLDYGACGSG
jgi:hypothetical protein